jgi:hypothetical protein
MRHKSKLKNLQQISLKKNSIIKLNGKKLKLDQQIKDNKLFFQEIQDVKIFLA